MSDALKIRDYHDVLLAPVVSLVDPSANKTEIKIAVEKVFKVSVTGVNTINRAGKKRRTRYGTGRRPNTKRAIVTVADGDRIDLFAQA